MFGDCSVNNSQSGIEDGGRNKKLSSVHIHAGAPPDGSCAFCWFVLKLYPDLGRITSRDSSLFREHLKKAHGWTEEIQQ
jgi:hypothetical protein